MGLLAAPLRRYAIALLGAIMIGAFGTVVRAGMSAAPPLIVGSLLALLAYLDERAPSLLEVER